MVSDMGIAFLLFYFEYAFGRKCENTTEINIYNLVLIKLELICVLFGVLEKATEWIMNEFN